MLFHIDAETILYNEKQMVMLQYLRPTVCICFSRQMIAEEMCLVKCVRTDCYILNYFLLYTIFRELSMSVQCHA